MLTRFSTTLTMLITIALGACTSPNASLARDDTDWAANSSDGASGGTEATNDGGGGEAVGGSDGGGDAADARLPSRPSSTACDGPSERREFPTCHGGTMERTADGEIVCHWPCIGHAEITAVAVEAAPGCYVLDDLICHQCTEQLPSSREPSGMPCPDVVRLLW